MRSWGVVSPIYPRARVLMWLRPLGDHQHLPEMNKHVNDLNFQLNYFRLKNVLGVTRTRWSLVLMHKIIMQDG